MPYIHKYTHKYTHTYTHTYIDTYVERGWKGMKGSGKVV